MLIVFTQFLITCQYGNVRTKIGFIFQLQSHPYIWYQINSFVTIPFSGRFLTNEIQFHTNEIQFHTNEIQFQTNEIQFHTNEIQFHTNEILFHTNEIQFHIFENQFQIFMK